MTARIISPLSDDQRAALIAAARTFRDVPYRHRGRSHHGVDCIGLVGCAFLAIGIQFQDQRVYSPAPDGSLLAEALTAHLGDPVWTAGSREPMALRRGDVTLMRWHKHPNHIGLVTDYPLSGQVAIIHSYSEAQRVVEHRIADPWPRRIVAAWRP